MKDKEKLTSKGLEFTPPKGFVGPEGAAAGKSFDLVCTFYSKPDGSLCMTKLGDTDLTSKEMEEDEEESEAPSKPDYSEYAQGMMGGMQGGGEMM